MFCPPGHSTNDGRETGTGIKGERYKKLLLLHTESRDGTVRPPTSIARHAPLRMHRSSLRVYVRRTTHDRFGASIKKGKCAFCTEKIESPRLTDVEHF